MSSSSDMGNNNDREDSLEACRKRRRRRIEMRRAAIAAAAAAGAGGSSHGGGGGGSSSTTVNNEDQAAVVNNNNVAPVQPYVADGVPVVGVMSVPGRLRDMEDAFTIKTSLCCPPINRHQPVHFFAVYDGHGGPHVAEMCRQYMHVIFEQEVMRVAGIAAATGTGSGSGGSSSNPVPKSRREMRREIEEPWRRVLMTSFMRMDQLAYHNGYKCGLGEKCRCYINDVSLSGSTAVVVILTQEYIIVANCGDSRALLCRGGRSVPLSIDHKPDREEERARIEAAGGIVVFNDGARLEGVLAMSRALGDSYLKPVVTAEPDIFIRKRHPQDECLILGSDGLWDVLPNNMAGHVARECLSHGGAGGAGGGGESSAGASSSSSRPWRSPEWNDGMFPSRSASAAGLLARLALGRQSWDNISVIVVDLKRNEIMHAAAP